MDGAKAWATATDVQDLARLISHRGNVRLVVTWTNDDSDDDARLSASDVPKQALTWPDLKATVIDALLKHEGQIGVTPQFVKNCTLSREPEVTQRLSFC